MKETGARRSVREAAERARWQADFENPGARAEPVSREESWVPTAAEARFLGRDAMLRRFQATVRAAERGSGLFQASYLAAILVEVGYLTEEQAKERLRATVKSGDLGSARAESTIASSYALACEHSLVARHPGSRAPVGGFSAIASASEVYDHKWRFSSGPSALLPLPVAVLVHAGHDARTDPVGVAIPSFVDGAVHIDAVFATRTTRARDAWTLTLKQRLDTVSISARPLEWHSGDRGQLVRGVLTAVDLVRSPADEKALVTKVVDGRALTAGQRATQEALDDYLADPHNPRGLDLGAAVERNGIAAMDCLAGVVAPMLEERGRRHVVGTSR